MRRHALLRTIALTLLMLSATGCPPPLEECVIDGELTLVLPGECPAN
jgi:hypothetical protein